MSLLGWLLGKRDAANRVLMITDWLLDGELKLPYAVETPLGGKVKCLTCSVDIYYCVGNNDLQIVKVRLANSSFVAATRRGEKWRADRRLKRLLENDVLPRAIDVLIAKDERLRRLMWGKGSNAIPATAKQKTFARKLGVAFDENISKQAISQLIDAALAEQRKSRGTSR